jgi:2-(1,2-epoxy-1,2-dihydrophenyl)acetyl-CoA isomerase
LLRLRRSTASDDSVEQTVLTQTVENGIAFLTLNRPECLNALSDELFAALRDAFVQLDSRSDVAVIVLTGHGKAFCAGGDVKQMPGRSMEHTFEERVADLQKRASVIQIIAESNKLTIAMVNGIAYGAGLSLALACDFRFAGRAGKFVTGYIKMGFSGDCGGIHLLANLLGAAKAKELFFLSDPVSAEEALRIGLITRCVEDSDLESATLIFARRLADGPRVAQRYMKQNFRNAQLPLGEALAAEAFYLIRTALTDDHAEAQQAFKQKRSPVFKGA